MNRDDIQSLQYIYSLGQVMSKERGKFLGFKDNQPVACFGNVIQDVLEAGINKKAAINFLGDITLVIKTLNSFLKNKSFEVMVKGYKSKYEYQQYISLKYTKKLLMILVMKIINGMRKLYLIDMNI